MLRERRKVIDLPVPELYDLARDPGETENLFADDRRVARAMVAALPAESRWPPEGGRGGERGEVSAEQAARLRSLGYAVGRAEAKAVYTAEDDPKNLIGLDRKLHGVVDAYSRGRYEEAVALAREAVAERPDLPEAYEHMALALRQMERHEEAITALREALSRGAERESLRRQLGLALSEAGRAAEAVAVLEPLAGGGEAQTVNALGIALSDAGRHGEARALLERQAARQPEDPKTWENLGIVALRMGRREEARASLTKAIERNDRLPIAWNTLGVALYQLGEPVAALAAWERSVELDGRQVDALYNIGLVAAEAGRAGQAKSALERFVASAPPRRWSAEIDNARQLLARLGA
jgi:tetratricopeptide (TPR) repeat protein